MSFELGLKILLALYVIVALAMIALILLQRGQGAQAGSGFGGGASATVFGSRGSANFLSISTKWLAVVFFALSIGMGVYISRNDQKIDGSVGDVGVMADADKLAPAAPAATAPAAASDVPAAPTSGSEVPSAPAGSSDVPAASDANAASRPVEVETAPATNDGEATKPEASN